MLEKEWGQEGTNDSKKVTSEIEFKAREAVCQSLNGRTDEKIFQPEKKKRCTKAQDFLFVFSFQMFLLWRFQKKDRIVC